MTGIACNRLGWFDLRVFDDYLPQESQWCVQGCYFQVPCADGINRESVATIMQTMMLQAGIFKCLLEGFPDRRLRKMTSIFMRKDQIRELSLVPQNSGNALLLLLMFLVFLQDVQHKRSGIDAAGLSVFQSTEGKRMPLMRASAMAFRSGCTMAEFSR